MNTTLTQNDIALARTTAHLLHTARYGWQLNVLVFAAQLWALWQNGAILYCVLECLLMVLVVFYFIRVRFDERLLRDIAIDKLHLTGLDKALAQLKLISPQVKSRPLSIRCAGCTRLLLIFYSLTLVHLLGLVALFFLHTLI